jgi:hypothetical protein
MKLRTRTYRKSALDEFTLHKAATLHARANSADPFAFGRILLHMRQGYVEPQEAITSASVKLEARGLSSGYME